MYSAAMSPPRCPVPRPSSRSCARNLTWARIFSESIEAIACSAAGGSPATFGTGGIAVDGVAGALLVCAKRRTEVRAMSSTIETGLYMRASGLYNEHQANPRLYVKHDALNVRNSRSNG